MMGVIHRFAGAGQTMRWRDVALETYDDPSARAVTKQVLIGPRDGAGGCSSLDRHAHDHGVVIMRGRGAVRLGDHEHEIGFGDVVYVAPHEMHQFVNRDDNEPLGFLCVVRS